MEPAWFVNEYGSRDANFEEYISDVEDELVDLTDDEDVPTTTTSLMSLSVAEEFVICAQCHRPVDSYSPAFASTPRPPTEAELYRRTAPRYASTPRPAPSTRTPAAAAAPPSGESPERPRRSSRSYAEHDLDLSDGGDGLTPDHSMSLIHDAIQRSLFLGSGFGCGQATDFDVSDECLPGLTCRRLSDSAHNALCGTCSVGASRKCERAAGDPGSRMSMYFPNKTGRDVDENGAGPDRHDGMCCSMNSEDSGACDVDVGIPSSHECSVRGGDEARSPTRRLRRHSARSHRKSPKTTDDQRHRYDNNSSFEVIHTPVGSGSASPFNEARSQSGRDDAEPVLTADEARIEQIRKAVDEKFDNVRRHLDGARKYYHELVEQWFWKNIIVLDREQHQVKQDQERQAEVTETAMDNVKRCVEKVEEAHSEIHATRYSDDLKSCLLQLANHVSELKQSASALTEVTFIAGRYDRLDADQLGRVVVQRRESGGRPPEGVLPGKCLWTFDSRGGATSDYMATGLALTSDGDVIVTDTGMDTVTVFSSRGVKKLDVNTAPGDYPTTATQFGDVIAVACNDEVKLYDMTEGVYSDRQLERCLEHPQGVATDKQGHLVVSGYRVDIPAVATYDRQAYSLNDVITGDSRCEPASEDPIGSELDAPTDRALFLRPWYVAVDRSDRLVVSDRDSHSLAVIGRDGDLVERLGCLGHRPGQFFHPAGICLDRHGSLIVADSQNNRIQMIPADRSSALSVLTQEHDGIECPTDVALDEKGLLYVLQGDGLVRVFQYC